MLLSRLLLTAMVVTDHTPETLMQKPGGMIDRDTAWRQCNEMWESGRPDLYIVRGRRRTGKSYLLSNFARAVGGIYYQATRKTERAQLATVTRIVGRRFDDPALQRLSFETWEDLFSYSIERAAGEPFLLILDEFPYLMDAAPALPSIIQSLWDHSLPDTRFKLVLSGSHITAMKRLTEADQPLFGRRTGLIQVDPFGYRHVGEWVPDYSAEDRIRLYGMVGGLPGHLALIDEARTLVENVARILLRPVGRLHEEAPHSFDAFVADAAVPNSIVEAIASGETRWSRISSRVGKSASSLARPLGWLLEMEVIERVAPITEYPNPDHKSAVYRLRDPYLQFWHTFIADLRAQGYPDILSPEELWEAFIAPRLDGYIGEHVFEVVCRQFVADSIHPALPFRAARVGSWWTANGSDEIDVVALDGSGSVLLGECKWGSVARDDLQKLERQADLILPHLGGVRTVSLALFSAGGISDTVVQRRIDAGDLLHFSADDLFVS
ncbi:MAG: ATP-binding protein [Gemmatimonadota bacterium]|nr:ATP-binding protein [Gemmatimonadota bacterium]